MARSLAKRKAREKAAAKKANLSLALLPSGSRSVTFTDSTLSQQTGLGPAQLMPPPAIPLQRSVNGRGEKSRKPSMRLDSCGLDSLKEELRLEVKSQVSAALSPISLQLKEQVDSSVRTLSGMIQDCLRQVLPIPSVDSLAGAGLTGDVALPVSSNLECSTALDVNDKGEPQPTKKRRTNVQSTSVSSGAQISTDVEIEENFPLISPRLIKGKNAGRGRSRPGLVSKDKSVLTVTDLVPGPASPCGQGSGQAGRVFQVTVGPVRSHRSRPGTAR